MQKLERESRLGSGATVPLWHHLDKIRTPFSNASPITTPPLDVFLCHHRKEKYSEPLRHVDVPLCCARELYTFFFYNKISWKNATANTPAVGWKRARSLTTLRSKAISYSSRYKSVSFGQGRVYLEIPVGTANFKLRAPGISTRRWRRSKLL